MPGLVQVPGCAYQKAAFWCCFATTATTEITALYTTQVLGRVWSEGKENWQKNPHLFCAMVREAGKLLHMYVMHSSLHPSPFIQPCHLSYRLAPNSCLNSWPYVTGDIFLGWFFAPHPPRGQFHQSLCLPLVKGAQLSFALTESGGVW